ncbi:hypothetical protein G4V62_05775 [Bacillaceae bacterium SIJ1]|uniref:hypothetical protein n=1 Tax=Litoribacterium kuwaitense TaxID=1398745 RepID=UPI0013E9C49F|nr:hypothetical protein [Litoribacterium kuwaitense]NGP44490.1 hypothetical protein [Litoribacterium kuwaitense]
MGQRWSDEEVQIIDRFIEVSYARKVLTRDLALLQAGQCAWKLLQPYERLLRRVLQQMSEELYQTKNELAANRIVIHEEERQKQYDGTTRLIFRVFFRGYERKREWQGTHLRQRVEKTIDAYFQRNCQQTS